MVTVMFTWMVTVMFTWMVTVMFTWMVTVMVTCMVTVMFTCMVTVTVTWKLGFVLCVLTVCCVFFIYEFVSWRAQLCCMW